MRWKWSWSSLLLASLLWQVMAAADAQIYQWSDDSGNVHFTQDLSQVPSRHRERAEAASAKPARTRVQTFAAPTGRPAAPGPRPTSGRASTAPVHRIRVQRAGNSLAVQVLVNDRLSVPFHIDTGASDVVLPGWAAEQLDLDLDGARTGVYGTANGTVTQKLVRLRSVSLEGARVEDVPATISESMKYGLLGLSFFNHFKYDIDPVAGIVTLRRNNLSETGVLRGGRSREQWRRQFATLQRRIGQMQTRRDEVPFSRTRKHEQLDREVQRLQRELKLLETEADDARVPFGWRD